MQIITSKENPRVKTLVKLRTNARYRRQSGLFVAEGLRVCRDAMISSAEIATRYATEAAMEKYADKIEE